MKTRSRRRDTYRGLLSVCRQKDAAWLKRAEHSFAHGLGQSVPYHIRVIRLAVRDAIREHEARVAVAS